MAIILLAWSYLRACLNLYDKICFSGFLCEMNIQRIPMKIKIHELNNAYFFEIAMPYLKEI